MNVVISKKHAAVLSPKVFKAKHTHTYKTVSTKGKTTNSPNPVSAAYFRRDPLAENSVQKSLENKRAPTAMNLQRPTEKKVRRKFAKVRRILFLKLWRTPMK